MIFSSKSDIEVELKNISAPVLAIGGSRDPDFDKPEEEIDWMLTIFKGQKYMVEGAGHYPHLEFPDLVSSQIKQFVYKIESQK